MKEYSKGKLKLKRFIVVFAILLVAVLVLGIVILFCFCLKDRINIVNESSEAINVAEDVALNSEPILIDNLVVGALYNNDWVSVTRYLKSSKKTNLDTHIYTKDNKAGEYKIKDTYSYGDSIFANTSYPNYVDQFFAIPGENYALISQFSEVAVQEKDYEAVKKALGIYRLYNSSMNIRNVYYGYVDADTPVRIICVTSSQKGLFDGIYSAIVVNYVDENKSQILQYSYTKDLDNTYDFPLYSVEFMADLNGDAVSEIVTREVTEFNVTYNVFECQKGKYIRVLAETMKGK